MDDWYEFLRTYGVEEEVLHGLLIRYAFGVMTVFAAARRRVGERLGDAREREARGDQPADAHLRPSARAPGETRCRGRRRRRS